MNKYIIKKMAAMTLLKTGDELNTSDVINYNVIEN